MRAEFGASAWEHCNQAASTPEVIRYAISEAYFNSRLLMKQHRKGWHQSLTCAGGRNVPWVCTQQLCFCPTVKVRWDVETKWEILPLRNIRSCWSGQETAAFCAVYSLCSTSPWPTGHRTSTKSKSYLQILITCCAALRLVNDYSGLGLNFTTSFRNLPPVNVLQLFRKNRVEFGCFNSRKANSSLPWQYKGH